MRHLIFILSLIFVSAYSSSAQTQSWQWIKAGGSNTDNLGAPAATCQISGCDAKGNVYAMGYVNGSNMVFDTFQSVGTFGPNGINQLIYSYDCSGNMRWAKQIGDMPGSLNTTLQGIVTDIQGNTYLSAVYDRGFTIGDTIIDGSLSANFYNYLIKLDSMGGIVWIKNYGVNSDGYSWLCHGIRIGSSGNLWVQCTMDSDYSFATTLHTSKQGNYNVEVDPFTGSILGGYYISNKSFGDLMYQLGNTGNFDLDEHENYYETGNIYGDFGGGGDTLVLAQRSFTVDTTKNNSMPYVFSLDKNGNFRFLLSDTDHVSFATLKSCRYDQQMHQLVMAMSLDPTTVYGTDTFRYNQSNGFGLGYSTGSMSIDTNGHVKWGKYITSTNTNAAINFQNPLTPNYFSNLATVGYVKYNNTDSIQSGIGDCTSNCSDFYRTILQIDNIGNFKAVYSAHLGQINTFVYGDHVQSGATDWRGNLYMGGDITNFMQLPNGDTVTNTDATSGNFFIAKIGISDCSCPTPGVQFTQASHGDTVTFYGSSINHSDSIHWELGDGTLSTTDTFTHVYADTGTYTVTAIAYSGCGIDSITKQVRLTPTGINTIQSLQTRAYPNPAQGSIYVDVSAAAKIGMVAANGTSMWDAPKEVNQSGTYVFDMGRYSAGLYYFLVEYSNGEVNVLQVVKE